VFLSRARQQAVCALFQQPARRLAANSRSFYNRILRLTTAVFGIIILAGCNRGTNHNDAVRQAVIDRLSQGGFPLSAMDVKVTNVETRGSEADATVAI
jgi:hypothetical protein